MSRPFATAITTSFNCPPGAQRTAKLGQRTIIVGPPSSGKSTLMRALQLALTGRGADVMFDPTTGVADIGKLSAMGAEGHPLFAQVDMSDGTAAVWAAEWGGKGWSKPQHVAPPCVDPRRVDIAANARAVLQKNDRGAALAFFNPLTTDGLTEEKVLAAFDATARSRVVDLLDEIAAGSRRPAPGEIVTLAAAAANAKRNDANREALRLERLAAGEEPPVVSDEDMAAARGGGGVDVVQLKLWELMQASQAQESMEEDEAAAKQKVAEARAALEALPAASSDPGQAQYLDVLAKIQSIEELILAESLTACPVCRAATDAPTICDELEATKRTIADILDETEAYRDGAARRKAAEAALASALEAHANLQRAVEKATGLYGALYEDFVLQYGQEAFDNAEWPTEEPTPPQADTEKLAEYARINAAHDEWMNATGRAAMLRNEAKTWMLLVNMCEAAGTRLAKSQAAPYIERANRFMPAGEELVVVERHGGKDVFLPSIRRASETLVRSALGGNEEQHVLLALAQAVAPPPELAAVFFGVDRATTVSSLTDWMSAISDTDVQIILTSTVLPNMLNPKLKGWTLIQLNG